MIVFATNVLNAQKMCIYGQTRRMRPDSSAAETKRIPNANAMTLEKDREYVISKGPRVDYVGDGELDDRRRKE